MSKGPAAGCSLISSSTGTEVSVIGTRQRRLTVGGSPCEHVPVCLCSGATMGGDQSRERTERDEEKPEDTAKPDDSQSQSAASEGKHFRRSSTF